MTCQINKNKPPKRTHTKKTFTLNYLWKPLFSYENVLCCKIPCSSVTGIAYLVLLISKEKVSSVLQVHKLFLCRRDNFNGREKADYIGPSLWRELSVHMKCLSTFHSRHSLSAFKGSCLYLFKTHPFPKQFTLQCIWFSLGEERENKPHIRY